MKKHFTLTGLITFSILTGCSTIHEGKESHIFAVNPVPAYDIGTIQNLKTFNVDYSINDKKVFLFSHYLKDTLRKKVKQGRVGEETFASFQVIFAALASAFSASTGVNPDVVTGLAGLSALSPDMANIINAGEKAKAYSQALELIEAAEALYLQSRAQVANDKTDLIPEDQLTPQGAALIVSSSAALKVMRDTLLGAIPKIEELEKAMGKYARFSMTDNLIKVEVTSTDLTMKKISNNKDNYKREVLVYKGEAISNCSSSAPLVASVSCDDPDDRITISPIAIGDSVISVISDKGELTTVRITVAVESENGTETPQNSTNSVTPQQDVSDDKTSAQTNDNPKASENSKE